MAANPLIEDHLHLSIPAVDVKEEAFPAPSKHVSGSVDGVPTEVTSMSFSDKIIVTLSQEGRLSQWIQVPLSAPSPALVDMALPSLGALPSTHLTPKTLLGGGSENRETLGQLLAAQIASHISLRNSEERRTLLLGLGLSKGEIGREAFFDVVELIQRVF